MVDAGLLQASFARPVSLRRAGRTPKLYAPAGAELQVSIPPREHALLAGILIDAVTTQAPEEDGRQAALRVAAGSGRQAGLSEQVRARPGRLGTERALTLACDTLEHHGFEPVRAAPTCVWLRNCPFQPLAAHAPDLVCGINQAFWAGYLDGLGAVTTTAVLAPRPGACCVELRAASPSRPPAGEPGP
jgi:predicted ArsR family transcriptional regulator